MMQVYLMQVSQTSSFKEQSQNQNSGKNPNKILYHLKLKNIDRLALCHRNISSFCYKFDTLEHFDIKDQIKDQMSET